MPRMKIKVSAKTARIVKSIRNAAMETASGTDLCSLWVVSDMVQLIRIKFYCDAKIRNRVQF